MNHRDVGVYGVYGDEPCPYTWCSLSQCRQARERKESISTCEPSTTSVPLVPEERFTTKDSGERLVFDSGMQRDVSTNKIDYSLTLDGPLFLRWAALLDRGARKYDKRNWMKAEGEAELVRFKESAMRHFIQWFYGDMDEDHAAAVLFNINGAEYVKEKLDGLKN